jgi:integrase
MIIFAYNQTVTNMASKNTKTTTYSLDWDVIVNLESRLLRDFNATHSPDKARELLMISIGARLGLRVIDNLALRWVDIMDLPAGERFVRVERKTGKERILVMSTKLREVLDAVINVIQPHREHFILTSQKAKGLEPMTVHTFNRLLKGIIVLPIFWTGK